MYKECELIILPTDEEMAVVCHMWTLWQLPLSNTLVTDNRINHLYVISDDEIKEGDWYYLVQENKTNLISKIASPTGIYKCKSAITGKLDTLSNNCKKVIATTDTSLIIDIPNGTASGKHTLHTNLPQLPQSFIQLYVDEYNKGNIITKVDVEYEELLGDAGIIAVAFKESDCKLKVSENNTINIKQTKDSYNREEVIKLCKEAFDAGHERGYSGYPNTENWNKPTFNNWIDNNL